jgi:hypothetical protein
MGQLAPVYGTIVPSQQMQPLITNYLAFDGGNNDFAQQFLPEVYEQEVERYGNRTLSGFLRMVGAEMPMTSDQVIWSEQNRLHVSYGTEAANGSQVQMNAAGTTLAITQRTVAQGFVQNVIQPNSTIVVMNTVTGATLKCIIGIAPTTGGGVTTLTPLSYTTATMVSLRDVPGVAAVTTNIKLFVYGSEFAKGTVGSQNGITPSFTQFSNSPIIIKDQYQISGSDTAQIGWVEVATEDGTSGYLWYLKGESETRLRFEDYLEMAMVEGELAVAGSGFVAGQANVPGFGASAGLGNSNGVAIAAKGTEGLFAAITARGNLMSGFNAGTGISDFDQILKNLDTQGAIEENMLFLNRSTDLGFDDMLGQISSGGAGGTAYGLFENSEQMALNLGFSGFRRGSYDFYKTSWKYLNDASTRGGLTVNSIDGVLVPAGTSTVYDQQLGTNIRRPFLHVRYRASQADDRRFKTWITGSVGGAYTSNLDAMQVQFLSERCLVTQAANNFVLFQA